MKYPIQVLFREYFEGIVAAIFLALFLRFFVLNIFYIPTTNMAPTLVKGDFVMGWRLSYGFPLPLMKGERLNLKVPDRGDVISFRFPGDEEQIIIRRVVGLPGDKLSIQAGVIKINDRELEQVEGAGGTVEKTPSGREYKILSNPGLEIDELVVPPESLFVLSDNRSKSDDSRDWGFVPVKNVESELMLVWLSVSGQNEGSEVLWSRVFNGID